MSQVGFPLLLNITNEENEMDLDSEGEDEIYGNVEYTKCIKLALKEALDENDTVSLYILNDS